MIWGGNYPYRRWKKNVSLHNIIYVPEIKITCRQKAGPLKKAAKLSIKKIQVI